jgi:hypothetical protein
MASVWPCKSMRYLMQYGVLDVDHANRIAAQVMA